MTNHKEKKNKKRGLVLTVFLHTAAVLIALYPFLISAEEPLQPQQIAVQFVDFKTPTAGASKSKKAKATKKAPKPTPKKEVKPTPQPKPQPKPTPKPKPVITTPEPEKTIETTPKVETPKKVEKPTPPAPPTPTIPAPVEEVAETAETAAEASSDEVSDVNESGSTIGTNEDGKDNGSSDLEGEGEGDDFSGDGLFRRKVVYRADIKKLIQKNGKITVDLCVNRQGNVVSATYNQELSTIKDKALIDKAVRATKRYRFEKDNSAAREQCGRLTFVCKVE